MKRDSKQHRWKLEKMNDLVELLNKWAEDGMHPVELEKVLMGGLLTLMAQGPGNTKSAIKRMDVYADKLKDSLSKHGVGGFETQDHGYGPQDWKEDEENETPDEEGWHGKLS